MPDTELTQAERNFVRHVRKHMMNYVTEAAKDHGIKLHDSDFDMMQHSLVDRMVGILKHRKGSNEQAAS